MKNLFLILAVTFTLSVYGESKLQIVHNSADKAAAVVDIYVNGDLYEDDFKFREATDNRTVPSGVELSVDIAPAGSASASESIFNKKFVLESGKSYIVVANGIVSESGYDPLTPFDLFVYDMAMDVAPEGKTHVMVFHGSTDAPTVDVVETMAPAGTILDNFMYSDFSGYLALDTRDYILDVRDESGINTVVSYSAPLQTLELEQTGLVVVASGFLDPSKNSDGDAFGLYVALPSGGNLVALPVHSYDMAKAQVIHNSADKAAEMVDVYINGMKAIDDFKFRTATPFLDLRAGVPTVIDIAPMASSSVSESIYNLTATLEKDKMYSLVANGIVSASGYEPAVGFEIHVYDMAMDVAPEGKTHVMVFHGSTDAPAVDVVETMAPAGTILDNFMYGSFSGYLELTTMDYILDVRDETGATTVASYSAPLKTLALEQTALLVVASGFLDPSNNSDGESFGLYAVLPSGGDMVELPRAEETPIMRIPTFESKIYPNPFKDRISIESEQPLKQIHVFDLTGRLVYTDRLNDVNNKVLPVSDLDPGNYVIRLSDIDNRTSSKTLYKL